MNRDAGSAGEEFEDQQGGRQQEDAGFAQLMNSFSLDSARPRRRRDKHAHRQRSEAAEPDEPPVVPVQPDGPAAEQPTPGAQNPHRSDDAAEQAPPRPVFDADLEDPATLVRPYAWTGGRTRSNLQLELETLVSSNEQVVVSLPALSREQDLITKLCRHPHSVAEVAAKLAVPLGVARVLLSDMIEQNLLSVHNSPGATDRAAHFNIMERVLSGLRRL